MKNFFVISVSLLMILLLSNSCKPTYNEIGVITVLNKTGENINMFYSTDYPDTTLKNSFSVCSMSFPDTISLAYDKGWKGRFNENALGVLIFFVVNRDSLIKYQGDEQYHQEQIVRRKYLLTVDSMEKNNWTIVYP